MPGGGSKPGEHRGGRVKGTPNQKTRTIQDTLARLGLDPIEGMAKIALGDVPCGVCRGKGRTKYQPAKGTRICERTCQSCYGSGLENVSPSLRMAALSELANYVHAKRKAVEVTGEDGQPIALRHEIVFVP